MRTLQLILNLDFKNFDSDLRKVSPERYKNLSFLGIFIFSKFEFVIEKTRIVKIKYCKKNDIKLIIFLYYNLKFVIEQIERFKFLN